MKDATDKSESAGPQKPRRKPLTIDLPAEEVERRAPADADGDAPSAAEPPVSADAGVEADPAPSASEPAPSPPEASAAAKREEDKSGEMPSREKPDDSASRKTAAPAEQPAKADPSIAFVPLLVAAVMGGVVVALVVVLLARGGFFLPPPDTEAADLAAEITTLRGDITALKEASVQDPVAPLRDEITSLRQSVAALQDREPVPASDTVALTDLEGRLGELTDDVAALKSTAPADSSAVAGEVASLRQELDALSAKLERAPDAGRIAAIESKLDATSRKIDDAAALAPAVAADALSAALDAGRPFARELAALKSLGVDEASLEALSSHADAGLPTLAGLRAAFESAIAGVDLAAPIAEGAGVVDRLMQSARGLVDVRPAHPTEGADPAAIVARIRSALDAGDLKIALSERETLPDNAKAATASWARDAEARADADALVAQLRAESLSRLEAGQ